MNWEGLLRQAERGVIFLGKDPLRELPSNLKLLQSFESPTMQTIKSLQNEDGAGTYLVVVEAGKALDKWCGLLEACCLRYGADYLDSLALRILYGPSKRLAVMYGNCQMHDYYDCMMLCPEFREDYEAVYFKYQEYPRWKEDRLELLLRHCSVLIYTKEGFDERFRNCRQYSNKHNPDCRAVKIPTYSYRGCFPQTNPHIQEKGYYDIIAETFNSFHREDLTINDMIRRGMSEDAIVDKAMSGTCFPTETIRRWNDISLKQIELMDRGSDISIADYVRSNYRKRRLFKDPVHMENEMVWHVSGQLLRLLGYTQAETVPVWTIHYFTELPIYPEVRQALGLEWPEEQFASEIRLAQGMVFANAEDFLRRYCRFADAAEAIRKSLEIQADTDRIKEWFPDYAP